MAEEIKVGDVVMLRSGGPRMTVGSVERTGSGQHAFCYWFGEGGVKTDKFPSAILDIVNDEDDS